MYLCTFINVNTIINYYHYVQRLLIWGLKHIASSSTSAQEFCVQALKLNVMRCKDLAQLNAKAMQYWLVIIYISRYYIYIYIYADI